MKQLRGFLFILSLQLVFGLSSASATSAGSGGKDGDCEHVLAGYVHGIFSLDRDVEGLKYFAPLVENVSKLVRPDEDYNRAQVDYINAGGLQYLKILLADLNPDEGGILMSLFGKDPNATVKRIIGRINSRAVEDPNHIVTRASYSYDYSQRVANTVIGSAAGDAVGFPWLGAMIGYHSTASAPQQVVTKTQVAVVSLSYPNVATGNPLRKMLQIPLHRLERIHANASTITKVLQTSFDNGKLRSEALKKLYMTLSFSSPEEFFESVLLAVQPQVLKANVSVSASDALISTLAHYNPQNKDLSLAATHRRLEQTLAEFMAIEIPQPSVETSLFTATVYSAMAVSSMQEFGVEPGVALQAEALALQVGVESCYEIDPTAAHRYFGNILKSAETTVLELQGKGPDARLAIKPPTSYEP